MIVKFWTSAACNTRLNEPEHTLCHGKDQGY